MKIKLLALVLLASFVAGCTPIVAHDPANQKQIDNLMRIDTAEKSYVFVEREITAAYKAGAIPLSVDKLLIDELQNVVRPLISSAKSVSIDGDFPTAIAKVETALNGLATKLSNVKNK